MATLLLPIIYLAFISLGLPDSLLGSAWPVLHHELNVPVSYAGIISMIIAFSTVISSLNSDRLTKKFGAGLVTAVSVAITCLSLFGFSVSHSFWLLCLIAIPYGLGGGSVDAALNNYVALHYKSRHMSWLHCMWGVGAASGPYLMGFALSRQNSWNMGYRYVGIFQVVLTAILFVSLPIWKTRKNENQVSESAESKQPSKVLSLKEILSIKGAKPIMLCFFCYCAVEQTTGLWAASYLNIFKGIEAETASFFASLFYTGITVGRAINGFITMKFSDKALIRIGQGIIASGILMLLIPGSNILALAGFIIIGLGCAPIYPCVIHSTPATFGEDKSQAIVGVQMASAYIGTTFMPPLFGLISKYISISLLPLYLTVLLITMTFMYSLVVKKSKRAN
ncbi:MAG: MFS transporter [Treponema sp.]|uniref:MFS transporter n=1 Tax=Treponema sp. TaxID=166 RepID=UPI002A910006|nr:MFS transporter [Treponema sp.]MDY6398993.1 MFS transporter [Treponema sp.]